MHQAFFLEPKIQITVHGSRVQEREAVLVVRRKTSKSSISEKIVMRSSGNQRGGSCINKSINLGRTPLMLLAKYKVV